MEFFGHWPAIGTSHCRTFFSNLPFQKFHSSHATDVLRCCSKEVVNNVVEQVGPTLGVRVHDVKPLHSGGAFIRTLSVVERQKIAMNNKLEEVDLEVSVNDKLGPRVVIRRDNSEISPDDFMSELFEMNLKDKMSEDGFKKAVRFGRPAMVVKPTWSLRTARR